MANYEYINFSGNPTMFYLAEGQITKEFIAKLTRLTFLPAGYPSVQCSSMSNSLPAASWRSWRSVGSASH